MSWLRKNIVMIGLVGFVLLGLIGAAIATGWEETLTQLSHLSFWQIGLLLVLSLFNYAFRGWRWHLFARHLGLDLRVKDNLRHFLGGFAMTVTPGRIGELVRMRWIERETGWAFERTAPLVLVDRAADLVAMALAMAVTLLISDGEIVGAWPVAGFSLAVAFLATRPKLLSLAATLSYRALGRLPRLFAKIRRAATSLLPFTKGGILTLGTVLGLIGWLAEGYAFYLLLSWMGADVSLSVSIAIFLFATLAGGLTGAPGGVGGAEAVMLGLLALEGVPLAVSVPATAIIRLTTLWFAIGIGLIVFPIAERVSNSSE